MNFNVKLYLINVCEIICLSLKIFTPERLLHSELKSNHTLFHCDKYNMRKYFDSYPSSRFNTLDNLSFSSKESFSHLPPLQKSLANPNSTLRSTHPRSIENPSTNLRCIRSTRVCARRTANPYPRRTCRVSNSTWSTGRPPRSSQWQRTSSSPWHPIGARSTCRRVQR